MHTVPFKTGQIQYKILQMCESMPALASSQAWSFPHAQAPWLPTPAMLMTGKTSKAC